MFLPLPLDDSFEVAFVLNAGMDVDEELYSPKEHADVPAAFVEVDKLTSLCTIDESDSTEVSLLLELEDLFMYAVSMEDEDPEF